MDTVIDDKLTFLSAVAVHAEMEDLLPQFTSKHGVDVDVSYDVNPAVAQRFIDGEYFDVGLTNPWYVDKMIALGRIIPNTHVPFGRVPLTIGAAGAPLEEISSSHEAVRSLLLNAHSIAYTSIGTSGKTFLRAIEMMGCRIRSAIVCGQWALANRRSPPRGARCSMPSLRYRGSSLLPASRLSRLFRRSWGWISTCPCLSIPTAAPGWLCGLFSFCRHPSKTPIFALMVFIGTGYE